VTESQAYDISIGPPPPLPPKVAEELQRQRTIVLLDRRPDDPPDLAARFLWPMVKEGWMVTGSLTVRSGAVEITTLALLPLEGIGPGRMTSEVLRGIPIGEIASQAQAKLAVNAEVARQLADWTGFDLDGSNGTRESIDRLAGAKNTTQGRPAIPDAILRLVAQTYLDEMDRPGLIHDVIAARLAGHPAVKAHLKGRQLTPGSVRYWIGLAQKRRFLGPGRQGTRRRAAGARLLDEPEAGQ
jgi:hypothetical protein